MSDYLEPALLPLFASATSLLTAATEIAIRPANHTTISANVRSAGVAVQSCEIFCFSCESFRSIPTAAVFPKPGLKLSVIKAASSGVKARESSAANLPNGSMKIFSSVFRV